MDLGFCGRTINTNRNSLQAGVELDQKLDDFKFDDFGKEFNLDTYGFITTCDIFHETVCREVGDLQPGHGCDGIDNDCDFVRDECDEDAYPPTISLSRANEFCGDNKHIFGTLEEAKACLETHVITADDCNAVTTVVESVALAAGAGLSFCGTTYQFTVTATENVCGKVTLATFNMLVDPAIPAGQTVCEFSKGPNEAPEIDLSESLAVCGGTKFHESSAEAKRCIESTLVTSDDCRSLVVTVTDIVVTDTDCLNQLGTTIHEFEITATVAGCTQSSTETMKVLVDPNILAPTCTFSFGPNVVPIIDTDLTKQLCEDKTFATIGEAEDCVLKNTKHSDDAGGCRPPVPTVSTSQVGSSCVHIVEVNVVDANISSCL